MCTLTLVGKILFYGEVEYVLVGLYREHLVVEDCLTTGVFSFLGVYCEFHCYFSIEMIEPLLPGMEPLSIIILCSGMILMTWRF